MNARELAVDLSFLRAAEREQLLAELPPQRRAELHALLEEVAGLKQAPGHKRSPVTGDHFEAHLADAEASARTSSFAHLNDGQLRLLLVAEHPAVQRRIATAMRDRHLAGLAPAVTAVVAGYLDRRVQANDIRVSTEPAHPRRRWWQRWQRASR